MEFENKSVGHISLTDGQHFWLRNTASTQIHFGKDSLRLISDIPLVHALQANTFRECHPDRNDRKDLE
jgi:hypothetical protein